MRRSLIYALAALVAGTAASQEAPNPIKPEDAWRYIGQEQTVCGQVINSAVGTSGTLLFLDRPSPEQVFSVGLPASRREEFGDDPGKALQGKRICVTSVINPDTRNGFVDRKHRAAVTLKDEDEIVFP